MKKCTSEEKRHERFLLVFKSASVSNYRILNRGSPATLITKPATILMATEMMTLAIP